jgi:DNA invertase Pin-like site-specific DNA recombinase
MASDAPPVPPNPIRAVAYIRVSQARDGMISPELQLRAIEQYCERRGYQITETLQDLDLSGRIWRHRQMEKAITRIEQDEADTIVVWRWSRISRNRLDWAVAVDRVEAAGGELESATEGFDTSTSTGRLARGVLAELAAFRIRAHGRRVARDPGTAHRPRSTQYRPGDVRLPQARRRAVRARPAHGADPG